MPIPDLSRPVDVLVVGTGPTGAAVARTVAQGGRWRVLAVDAGVQLTAAPGRNLRNVPARDRARLRRLAEGRFSNAIPEAAHSHAWRTNAEARGIAPLVASAENLQGLAGSTCIGGMGVLWSGASPRPGPQERPEFIDAPAFDRALDRAEQLLGVRANPFHDEPAVLWTRRHMRTLHRGNLSRPSALPMPLACRVLPDGGIEWSGVDTVLGSRRKRGQLELWPQTLARRLVLNDHSSVSAVELVDLKAEKSYVVPVRACVVAADALRAPQLLWASGLRGPALGRYLNDHILVTAAVALPARVRQVPQSPLDDPRDFVIGASWLPCDPGAGHAHGQVLHMPGMSGHRLSEHALLGGAVAVLGWYLPKMPSPDDRVFYDDHRQDAYGMPQACVEYRLLPEDHQRVAHAMEELHRLETGTLGFLPGCRPRLQPVGTSMHYQGTTRMGGEDDGTSVCAQDGRVWGSSNVFVAGNSVISTMTATNPTLTSVAHALRTAMSVLHLLDA